MSVFLRSSQYCDVDSDCGNPKDRCCSNLGTCHDKRGLDESCNFVVSEFCYIVPEIVFKGYYFESSTRLRNWHNKECI